MMPLSGFPAYLFKKLTGRWEGSSKTWFEPGKLADESHIRGEFTTVFEGQFLRHTYQGFIEGKPRHGEEMMAFNPITRLFQVAWVDNFHMSTAIMLLQGRATDLGFSVQGEYDVGENQPRCGWRSELVLHDENHLTLTAFNITPEGREAKAVEVHYQRVISITETPGQ